MWDGSIKVGFTDTEDPS